MSSSPEIFVPDLRKPIAAKVDADGNVTCVACGTRIPVADADVVGLGYRCRACTEVAQVAELDRGEADTAAHLTAAEHAKLPRVTTGRNLILLGVCLLVVGAMLWIADVAVPLSHGIPLPLWVLGAGVGSIAIGLTRIRGAGGARVDPTK